MSKLIYAKSLEAFKTAFADYASATSTVYRSVAYTEDGYIITHGTVMKTSTGDAGNPYGLDFTLNGQSAAVTVAGVTKAITLPIIGVGANTDLTASIANGVATIKHNASGATAGTYGAAAASSDSIVVPKVIVNAQGHVTGISNFTATLNQVKRTSGTQGALLIAAASAGTGEVQYNSSITTNGGTLTATEFVEGSVKLAEKYAPISHVNVIGNSTVSGHLKLSDSTTSTSGVSGGTAATPNAVKLALDAAKSYADTQLSGAGALIYKGSVGSTADLTNSADKPALGYRKGWTFKASAVITLATGKVAEAGDMIVANSDASGNTFVSAHWDIFQANIDGAVTSTSTLTANQLILGSGNRDVKALANGSADQILKIVNGIPTWSTHHTSRAILVNGTAFLNANTATALNLKQGTNVTLSTNADGTVTVNSSFTNTTYTAGTGLNLTGTQFSLKTATSSEIGGVKSVATGTTAGRDYNVEVKSDGTMKVNVPWVDTDTTYTVGVYNKAGLIRPFKSYTAAATGITESTSTATVAVTALSSTAGRYYAVEMDSVGRAFVNVPWVDTNTTYSYKTYVGATGSASNAVTANGATYLKFYNGSTSVSAHKISGTGSASVTSDASGNIIVDAINSWRKVRACAVSNLTANDILPTTVGTADLEFSSDFAYSGTTADSAVMHIVWTEIDATGNITYHV